MHRLDRYAQHLGVTVERTPDLDPRFPGDYSHRSRHVRVLDGMTQVKTRSVLAHELGHASYGDEPIQCPRAAERMERRADEWAAHFLIDTTEYRLAEQRYGENLEWLAHELGVLPRLVRAYRRTLRRVGGTVCVEPDPSSLIEHLCFDADP
ncbi:hypothetical protein H490_0103320 [Leucobacter sp. UCD-THU]|uniref:ImmA/IrrE family metallo-endopeptidase n=1 Tax=Leucobacter sp. UCD-THU TaxID=1292023 RepID=UPI0003646169|nr:ImmA/IrrE family metallo-endopeptidase [Leucobacter sp. UCD-THU]EYT56189.1 hypothetical protein H490_0103320 [Leucobacter sp. UCD-THU]